MGINIFLCGGPPPLRYPPFNRPKSGLLTFNPFKAVKNRSSGKPVRSQATQLRTGAIWEKIMRLLMISGLLCALLMEESPIGKLYVRAQFTNGADGTGSTSFESTTGTIGTLDDQFNMWDENQEQRVDVVTSDYLGTLYFAGTTTASPMTPQASFNAQDYHNKQKPWIRASGNYQWILLLDHLIISKVLDLKFIDNNQHDFTAANVNEKVERPTDHDYKLFALLKFNKDYYSEAYANSRAKIVFIHANGGIQKQLTYEAQFAYFQPWHSMFARYQSTNYAKLYLLNNNKDTSSGTAKWSFTITTITPARVSGNTYQLIKNTRSAGANDNVKGFAVTVKYARLVVGGSYQDTPNGSIYPYLAIYEQASTTIRKEVILKNFGANINVAVVHLLSHPYVSPVATIQYEYVGLMQVVDQNIEFGAGNTFYYFKFLFNPDSDGIACDSSIYVKQADENGQATCPSGVIRFGVEWLNVWSADIAVTGQYTCSSSNFGITDIAPGEIHECQCKEDNPQTVFVRKVTLGSLNPYIHLLPLGLRYHRYGQDIFKLVTTFALHDALNYVYEDIYKAGFSSTQMISLSFGLASSTATESCNNQIYSNVDPDYYGFDDSKVVCNNEEVFISPATIECESQNTCMNTMFYIASGKTKNDGGSCSSSTKSMVHADLIVSPGQSFQQAFAGATNEVVSTLVEETITPAYDKVSLTGQTFEAACDFVAQTIPNLFANFAQSRYIDATSTTTSRVEWFFPNFGGTNCFVFGPTYTYIAPTQSVFSTGLAANIDYIETESAQTTLLSSHDNITTNADYSRFQNYYKLSFDKSDLGWESLPGPDIELTGFSATSTKTDTPLQVKQNPYVAGGDGPWLNSAADMQTASNTCYCSTQTGSNFWWKARFSGTTPRNVFAVMVLAPATLGDTTNGWQHTGIKVEIDANECQTLDLQAGQWTTVSCAQGAINYATGSQVRFSYPTSNTDKKIVQFCGVRVLSYDQNLKQLQGAQIQMKMMNELSVQPVATPLTMPTLIVQIAAASTACTDAASASLKSGAVTAFTYSQQDGTGKWQKIDLNAIFDVADPCSTGEKFINVYYDSQCTSQNTFWSINDQNELQVAISNTHGSATQGDDYYVSFGYDSATALCMSAVPIYVSVQACTFSEPSATTSNTDLVFQVIKDGNSGAVELQNQDGSLTNMFASYLSDQYKYTQAYWDAQSSYVDLTQECGWDQWIYEQVLHNNVDTVSSTELLHIDSVSSSNLKLFQDPSTETGLKTYNIKAKVGSKGISVQQTLHLAIVAQQEATNRIQSYDINRLANGQFTIPKADYMVALGSCEPQYVIFQNIDATKTNNCDIVEASSCSEHSECLGNRRCAISANSCYGTSGCEQNTINQKKDDKITKDFNTQTSSTQSVDLSLGKIMNTNQDPTMTLSTGTYRVCGNAIDFASQKNSFGQIPIQVINFYDKSCTSNSQVVSLTPNFICGYQTYTMQLKSGKSYKHYLAYDSTLTSLDKETIEIHDIVEFVSDNACCSDIMKIAISTNPSSYNANVLVTVNTHTNVVSSDDFVSKITVQLAKNYEHNLELYIRIRKISPVTAQIFQKFENQKLEIISCKSTVPKSNDPNAEIVSGSNAIKLIDKVYTVGYTEEVICNLITFSSMKNQITTDTSQGGNHQECLEVTRDNNFWIYDSTSNPQWSVATVTQGLNVHYYQARDSSTAGTTSDQICFKKQTQPFAYDFNVKYKTKGSQEIYFNIKITGTQKALSLTNETASIELFEKTKMTQTSRVDISSYYRYTSDRPTLSIQKLKSDGSGNYELYTSANGVEVEVSQLGILSYKVQESGSYKNFAVNVQKSGISIYIKIDLLVCGNEKITTTTSSPTAIDIELNLGDDTEYLTSLSVLSSFSSTEEKCWKKDISLRQGPLKLPFVGTKVGYDEVKDQIYVVKSASTTEKLTLYVTSTSYSGVEGYFEIQLNMFDKYNYPPKFASDPQDISIKVKEVDQLSGSLNSTIFSSPEAQDVERHNILMAFIVPKNAEGFIKLTQKQNIFEMEINNQVISQSGSYTISVVLTDDYLIQSAKSTYEFIVKVNFEKEASTAFTGVAIEKIDTSTEDTELDRGTLPGLDSLEDTDKVNGTLSISNLRDSNSSLSFENSSSNATIWDSFVDDDDSRPSSEKFGSQGYDSQEETIKRVERRQRENVASVIKDSGLDEKTSGAIFKIVSGSIKKEDATPEMQDFMKSMEQNAEVEALNITDVPVPEEEIEQAMENFGALTSPEGGDEDLSPLEAVKRKLSYKSQTKAVGRTFPDVDVEQIKQLQKNLQKKEKPPPEPQMKVKPMSPTGKLAIVFNQDMLVPKDPSKINYGAILVFKITSAVDGSVTTVRSRDPEKKKKRNLRIPGQRYLFDSSFDDQEEDGEEELTFDWKLEGHDPRELGLVIKFDQPDQISNSNYGNDIMDIEVKDPEIFKSAESGKSMSKNSFKKGDSSLGVALPPQVADENIVDDIKGNVDAANSVGNLIGGSNFLVAILIGGSLQQLWSLIRSLQLLILTSLCDIMYPAIANIFYQNAIQIAQLDIFQGESISRSIFDFKTTEPLNPKFEQFSIDSKNFMINSGSFFLMALVMILEVLIKKMVLMVCLKFTQFRCMRILGMKCQVSVVKDLRSVFIRLCMESYFDIVICAALGLFAFIESADLEDFGDFWSNPSNIWNSSITVLGCIGIIVFPCWVYLKIKKNFDRLGAKENRELYGILYEEYKTNNYESSQYQTIFMARRFAIVIVLIVSRNYAVWQLFAFMILSCMNLAYLMKRQPFVCTLANRVELFNEVCVYTSLLFTTTLTNAAVNMQFRNNCGWCLVGIAVLNIVGNIAVVAFTTSTDAYNGCMESKEKKHLQEIVKKKLENREFFAKLMPGEFDDLEEIKFEFVAKQNCEDWIPQRRWMSKNGVNFSKYPEELQFQEQLKEYKFFRRAAALQLLHAHNLIREELVAKKMNTEFQRQKIALSQRQKVPAKLKKRPKKLNVSNIGKVVLNQAKDLKRTNLAAISEESGTQESGRFTILNDKKVQIEDTKFQERVMLEMQEIDQDRTLKENQIDMVKCIDKMQFKIDPERLDALQELYDDRQNDELSLDDRVKLRTAIIEERRDYDTSWLDVDHGAVIKGETEYLDEIDIKNFKVEDFSKFHLEKHGTLEDNVNQVYAEIKENQKIVAAEDSKLKQFRKFGVNNCLGASLQIFMHFESLAIYLAEMEQSGDSKRLSTAMRSLFKKFGEETEEVQRLYKIEKSLSKELLDVNIEITEPAQFFKHLVNSLRVEVDEQSSKNGFFRKNRTDERVTQFAEDSQINLLFMLVFKETYECKEEHAEKPRLYAANFLTFHDNEDYSQTVMKALEDSFVQQRQTRFCQSCGENSNGYIQASIVHFPQILAIRMKRDEPDNSVLFKIDLGSLRPSAQKQNGPITYGLIALIILEGTKYKSIVKKFSKWYLFDGKSRAVEISDPEDVVSEYTPYMLFYHKD